MNQIDVFISKLQDENAQSNSENLYQLISKEGEIRSYNLKQYLSLMAFKQPSVLIVGEAPGFHGCKFSGIPFTSEYILFTNPFFKNLNFQFISSVDLKKENSATIVWDEIDKSDNKPLIWNIYPFHPYRPENVSKNRTPHYNELIFGKKYVKELIEIFGIKKIGAIGRLAESMISDLGIEYEYIRHPSYGGKSKFIEGLNKILK